MSTRRPAAEDLGVRVQQGHRGEQDEDGLDLGVIVGCSGQTQCRGKPVGQGVRRQGLQSCRLQWPGKEAWDTNSLGFPLFWGGVSPSY